jgi:hypothetical protein
MAAGEARVGPECLLVSATNAASANAVRLPEEEVLLLRDPYPTRLLDGGTGAGVLSKLWTVLRRTSLR